MIEPGLASFRGHQPPRHHLGRRSSTWSRPGLGPFMYSSQPFYFPLISRSLCVALVFFFFPFFFGTVLFSTIASKAHQLGTTSMQRHLFNPVMHIWRARREYQHTASPTVSSVRISIGPLARLLVRHCERGTINVLVPGRRHARRHFAKRPTGHVGG